MLLSCIGIHLHREWRGRWWDELEGLGEVIEGSLARFKEEHPVVKVEFFLAEIDVVLGIVGRRLLAEAVQDRIKHAAVEVLALWVVEQHVNVAVDLYLGIQIYHLLIPIQL